MQDNGGNKMKINNKALVKRWDNVMWDIGVEHMTIDTKLSELEDHKEEYGLEDGVDIVWMINEAEYWLSCYYEEGHCRCDDRFYSKEGYKTWLSESGKLKRLITKLKSMENCMVVEW